jgi:hypothetical protein
VAAALLAHHPGGAVEATDVWPTRAELEIAISTLVRRLPT